MDVGTPQREIYVEPLQLPEPLRPSREPMPVEEPATTPEKVPERTR